MSDKPDTPRAAFGRIIAVIVAAIILVLGIAARGDTVRLRSEAAAAGDQVLLREIAELRGPLAQRHAETVVHTFRGERGEAQVSMQAVRQALSDAGINWGLVGLAGYQSCRVHHHGRADERPAQPLDTAAAAPTAANPADPVSINEAPPLRAMVVEKLSALASVPADDLRITFSDRDAATLSRGLLAGRYEIEPQATAIGRVPVTIRRYESGEPVETLSIAAEVERRVMAAVATRSIGRGDRFEPGSVELREVYLRDGRGEPVTDLDLVLGQVAAGQLREGHVIYPSAVASPVLVRRGELVTVRCLSGGLSVRTVGRAGADGRLDELIEIRNESTRQTYAATVTGSREVTIRLDMPAVAAAQPADTAQEMIR